MQRVPASHKDIATCFPQTAPILILWIGLRVTLGEKSVPNPVFWEGSKHTAFGPCTGQKSFFSFFLVWKMRRNLGGTSCQWNFHVLNLSEIAGKQHQKYLKNFGFVLTKFFGIFHTKAFAFGLFVIIIIIIHYFGIILLLFLLFISSSELWCDVDFLWEWVSRRMIRHSFVQHDFMIFQSIATTDWCPQFLIAPLMMILPPLGCKISGNTFNRSRCLDYCHHFCWSP